MAALKTLKSASLKEVDHCGLLALYDAFNDAWNAVTGVLLQPRADVPEVQDILDAEMERFRLSMQAVVEEVQSRTPADSRDRDTRAEVLSRWGFLCGDTKLIVTAIEDLRPCAV